METYEIRRKARETLHGNWLPAVLVAFIAGILGSLFSGAKSFSIEFPSQFLEDAPVILTIIFTIISIAAGILGTARLALGGVVQLGYAQYLLKQQDHVECGVKDLFSQFDRFGQGFLQLFLRNLYTFLWGLLLVIPGIVKSFSYAMTPFIMAENPHLTAKEAITLSREMMDGHKMDLFILDLSFIGWSILATLSLGIGYLFLNPYMNVSHAIFYRSISRPAVTVEVIEE